WNFSENTKLSECLIVAEWTGPGGGTSPTKVVNLWTKPSSSVDALTVASFVRQKQGASLDDTSGTDELRTARVKFGEIVQVPANQIIRGKWNEGAVFAQTELSRVAHCLLQGQIVIPGKGIVGRVSLKKLKSMADIGPDRRD